MKLQHHFNRKRTEFIMYQFPIGAVLESFRLDPLTALKKAAAIGLNGVQIYATKDRLNDPTFCKTVKAAADQLGLQIPAVCGDLGYKFHLPDQNTAQLEDMKRVYDFAQQLGTNIVTTHIGVIPADPAHPRYGIMQEACGYLAEYAAAQNAYFAIETGPESVDVLKAFLDSLHSKGIGVNLDPGNLAMVIGDAAEYAAKTFGSYIVHTHAKDGIKLKDGDSELMHGLKPQPADYRESDYCLEVPLGRGAVNWPAYLQALTDIGYRGFLTIERECGDTPADDIALATAFLKAQMK